MLHNVRKNFFLNFNTTSTALQLFILVQKHLLRNFDEQKWKQKNLKHYGLKKNIFSYWNTLNVFADYLYMFWFVPHRKYNSSVKRLHYTTQDLLTATSTITKTNVI